MKKKFVNRVLVAMGTMFIVGLILIFSSSSMGRMAGESAIQNNGGSMDTDQFERVMNETTTSY